MSISHTPGPWIVDPAEDVPLAVIQDTPDGFGVAEIVAQGPEGEADARLIAAAPDMLEALQRIVAVTYHDPDLYGDILGWACAAIAKAEGSAQP